MQNERYMWLYFQKWETEKIYGSERRKELKKSEAFHTWEIFSAK